MHLLESIIVVTNVLFVLAADDQGISPKLHENVLHYIKNYIQGATVSSTQGPCTVYKNCNTYRKAAEHMHSSFNFSQDGNVEVNDAGVFQRKLCGVYKNCNAYKKPKESTPSALKFYEKNIKYDSSITRSENKPCAVYKNCNTSKKPGESMSKLFKFYEGRLEVENEHPFQVLSATSSSFSSINKWQHNIKLMRKPIDSDMINFQTDWPQFLPLFDTDSPNNRNEEWTNLPVRSAVEVMSLSTDFINIFWPFRFDVQKMNQKLAVHGLASSDLFQKTKTMFFNSLKNILMVDLPFEKEHIVISFNHPELVHWLNQTNLVSYSPDFVRGARHLFSKEEEIEIRRKTNQALLLINSISPDLYKSIAQLVACVAYYKSETPGHVSGTIPNTIGVLWIDPTGEGEWSVPFYAEQIVHEFIHTALFYAELVHGVYDKYDLLTKVKTVSAIRRELRDYDRSFHAAYVSAGLVTFNARAGYLDRAGQLASTLKSSVDELVAKNNDWQILTESGAGMLHFLRDYVSITRMI